MPQAHGAPCPHRQICLTHFLARNKKQMFLPNGIADRGPLLVATVTQKPNNLPGAHIVNAELQVIGVCCGSTP